MKKLMFAMVIAATVGFAQADTEIGTTTDFDSLAADTAFDTDTDQQWTNNTDTEGPVDATVKAYDPADANNPNYLQLDGVQNLAKEINTSIGDGLYIDTMVKFTASEDAPTPGEGDKLVVWLKETPGENDNPSTYTLMVTAGYCTDDVYSIASTNYPINGAFAPDVWYNLKVKAITGFDQSVNEIPLTGFVILINDNVVATSEAIGDTSIGKFDPEAFDGGAAGKYVGDGTFSIFPSLLDYNAEGYNTITQLAFSGSGSIDTVAAFQGDCDPDPVVETYAVTYTGAENATVVTDPADTTALAAGATVDFTVTPAENYEYATTPTGWTAGANGAITMTYTVVAGQNVVTIPEPTAKAPAGGYDSGDGTNTFTIDSAKETTLTGKLPAGKTLGDVADATTGVTYAQAYALGLFDENTGDVADLDATISVGADGNVTVTLANAPTDGYLVTCKVYEKASLTADWPTEAKATYAYGSEVPFTPGSDTAGFYKVEVVIRNALGE